MTVRGERRFGGCEAQGGHRLQRLFVCQLLTVAEVRGFGGCEAQGERFRRPSLGRRRLNLLVIGLGEIPAHRCSRDDFGGVLGYISAARLERWLWLQRGDG